MRYIQYLNKMINRKCMGDGERTQRSSSQATTHLGALPQQQENDKTTCKGTLEFETILP